MPPDPSGWPWPLDAVQKWFENLLSKVWEAASWAASKIWDMLPWWIRKGLEFLGSLAKGAWNAVWSFFKDPVGTLAGLAGKVWDLLPDWIRRPINFLAQLAGTVWNRLIAFFKDPVGTLMGVARAVWDLLPDWIRGPINFLKTLADTVWSALIAFFKDPVGTLKAGWDAATKAVSGFVSDLWGKISSAVGGAVQTMRTALDGGIKMIGGLVGDVLKNIVGALGEGVRGFFDWVLKHLVWLGQMLAGAIQAVAASIRGTLTPIFNQVVSGFAKELMPGSPDPEVEAAAHTVAQNLYNRVMLEIEKAHKSPAQPELAIAAGVGVLGAMTTVSTIAHTLGAVFDATHPIKKWGTHEMITHIEYNLLSSAFGSPIMQAPVIVGILRPMRYAYNKMFKPEIPAIPDATRMLWRGKLTEAQFTDVVAYQGFGGSYAEGYLDLTKAIPPWQDLVTMAVREVFPPEDFYVYMPLHGFSREWAERYWEMHWILLPLGEVRRARHRGLISDGELGKYLVLHDYKPEPRPGIRTSDRDLARKLAWDLPGRIEARWMFRWGIRDRDGLKELLIKGGLDPEYADEVADAVATNQFLREIRMQETNIKADLRDGYIKEATARADLYEIGYPGPFIEYHIKDALKDRERSHKKSLLSHYQDCFLKDIPTEPPFEDAVRQILVVEEAADLFIERTYVKKMGKTKAG